MGLDIPSAEQTYGWKETALYALGIGVATDPLALDELPFVYEKDMRVMPTMAGVLAHPGFWARDLDTGIDWVKVVHGEQGLVLHKPLPAAATVIGINRVVEVIDKGLGRGALVFTERKVYEKSTGDHLATVSQTTFCRGDGGFGGLERPQPAPHKLPDRAPDLVCDLPSQANLALVYRLSGDYNPLHADPAVAKAAGFDRPILHGLATYGIACHALVRSVCGYRPEQLASMGARFTSPVFPGETFRTEIWRDANVVSFQVRCLERDVIAISNGRAELRP